MAEIIIDTIWQELSRIQKALNVPKTRFNKFGDFYYRSCEDILETLKTITTYAILLEDTVVAYGDKIYVKATASLISSDGQKVSTTAYAREEENRPKMSPAQLTGAASSYARKYALNALFCIDDTKDADADEPRSDTKKQQYHPTTVQIEPKSVGKSLNNYSNVIDNYRNFIANVKDVKELEKIYKEAVYAGFKKEIIPLCREKKLELERTAFDDLEAPEQKYQPPFISTTEASVKQIQKISVMLGSLTRDEKHRKIMDIIKRPIESTKELTKDEASKVIEILSNPELT